LSDKAKRAGHARNDLTAGPMNTESCTQIVRKQRKISGLWLTTWAHVLFRTKIWWNSTVRI